MRRAQLLSIDFILSAAIFLSILLTLSSIWSAVDTQVKDVESRRELQSLSIAISDSLVRSPGNPADWNSSNVQSIGLASVERVLSLKKIKALTGTNYYDSKSRMRLANYDLQIVFADYKGYNLTSGVIRSPMAYYSRSASKTRILQKLTASGLVWDFYWGDQESQLPGGNRNAFSQRNYFERGMGDQSEFFNSLVSNQASYRTIIVENLDPNEFGAANSDLNISGLQEFVSRGGILVVVGQGIPGANLIDQNFSVSSEYAVNGWGTGTAVDPWYMLPENSIGNSVSFASDHWYFHSQQGQPEVKTIVSVTGTTDRGMICFWQYGLGRIYYIEDLEGVLQGGTLLQDATTIVGTNLAFGLSPSLPEQVVTVRRMGILEGVDREPVSMLMRVWKASE